MKMSIRYICGLVFLVLGLFMLIDGMIHDITWSYYTGVGLISLYCVTVEYGIQNAKRHKI